jgi:elongation factor P
MKIGANEIKPGVVLELDGKLFIVLKRETIERFRTQETVERARLDEQEMQFLYFEGNLATFMDQETFEQINIDREMIGDPADFLADGMVVTVTLHDGVPLGVELPQTVTLELVEADPVVKGQTASSSYKPGKLSNGRRVLVPPHLEAGTRVVVSTEDGSYLERAKD